MPKKKQENQLSEKEQFERFKKTTRELGVDESGKPLDEAFKRVANNQVRRERRKG